MRGYQEIFSSFAIELQRLLIAEKKPEGFAEALPPSRYGTSWF
jgi:hypothetical protein